ncbi:TPA: PsaF/MyfF family fimbrial adhesin regulatory protein [Escherichia coli]
MLFYTMKISYVCFGILSLITTLLIINHNNNVNIYSEREYKNILEHTDIRIDGIKFNILHYMLDNSSKLIISETLSGIVVRTSLHGYVLIPFHKYKTSNTGTLQSIGNVFSLCAYHSNDNNIVFFDGSRAALSDSNKIIMPPTIFLGQKEHTKHPAWLNESTPPIRTIDY